MSSIEPEDPFFSEGELKGVLELWSVPEPSKTLDERVSNSYYMEYGSDGAANQPIALPQSQKEVVTMKFCSTCQEEFAEKFSFCPVDGTPLNGFVPREDESVTRAPAQDAGVRVVPSTTPATPTRTSPPVHAAAAAAGATPAAGAAAAPAAAGAPAAGGDAKKEEGKPAAAGAGAAKAAAAPKKEGGKK